VQWETFDQAHNELRAVLLPVSGLNVINPICELDWQISRSVAVVMVTDNVGFGQQKSHSEQ